MNNPFALLFLVFTMALGLSANAEVTPMILNSDKAILFIEGGNSDAKRLYDSLKIASNDTGEGNFSKVLKIVEGQFHIVCNSNSESSNSSCTIDLVNGDYPMDIDAGNVSVSLEMTGDPAINFFNAVSPDSDEEFEYTSEDGLLLIRGTEQKVTLSYNQ